jgi:hypothetical protein
MSKPNLAVVETIYESNSTDIVAMLRKLADDIESGKLGDVNELALVHGGDKGVHTYGFGVTNGASIYMLFALGMKYILDGVARLSAERE